MGTILAQVIVDKVEAILQDPSHLVAQWTEAFHLANLNEAQKQIVVLKPDTYVVRGSVLLVTGSKQALAAGEIALIEISRNMGTDGLTAGNAITLVDKAVMDAVLPSWMTVTTAGAILHYMYDIKDPKVFYIYPGRPASPAWYVEMARSSTPADIAIGTAITLDDAYETAIQYWMLYKAYLIKRKDIASGFYAQFKEALGIRDQREETDNPNLKPIKGGTP